MVLRGHEDAVTALGFSPDNHWLATGSADETARLWDLTAKDPAANPVVLRGHEGAVSAVAISHDNRWLVTGSWDSTARLWDLRAKDPSASSVVLQCRGGLAPAVGFSPDSRWLAVAGSEKAFGANFTALLWPLQVNELVDLARITVGRNFSATEWRIYFPGEKYRKTFPDLPGPD